MAKELPFFKFEPNQWDNGNIQMLARSDKGLFIDLCCMYWSRLGSVPFKLAIQKLCDGNALALNPLCDEKIIEIIDGNVYIKFLSEQLLEFNNTSEQNSKNAKERWEKLRKQRDECERNVSALNPQCERNAIREEKIREEKIREEKKKKTLLSEIEISDLEGDSLKIYFTTAKYFQKVFIKNLTDKNASTKNQEKATFRDYVNPIRLMIENKECTMEDLREVAKFLNSPDGEFWKSNILSTKSLRKNITTLLMRAREDKTVKKAPQKQFFNSPIL
jgi:hypothetical protein